MIHVLETTPVCRLPNVVAIAPDDHDGFFLATRPANVWHQSKSGAIRHLVAVPLAQLRSLCYDPTSATLFVLVGGLRHWHGLGYLLTIPVGPAFAVRLLAAHGRALASIMMSTVWEVIRALARREAGQDALAQKLIARLKLGHLGRGLSWPTGLHRSIATNELLVLLSKGVFATPLSKPGRLRPVTSGYLNLVQASPWVDDHLLLSELHLFNPGLHRKLGIGAGALWDFDKRTGERKLIAGGLAEGALAAPLITGKSFAIVCRNAADGSRRLHVVDIPSASIQPVDLVLDEEPTLLVAESETSLFLGTPGGVDRLQLSLP